MAMSGSPYSSVGADDEAAVERVLGSVEAAVDQALADLDAMRVREGGHLQADLDGRRALGGVPLDAQHLRAVAR